MGARALQFKVTLRGVDPPVWRRIQVPAGGTFWGLHVAIQDAMGWADGAIHRFRVPDPATGIAEEIGAPDPDDPEDDPGFLIDWEAPLANFFEQEGDAALYLYDPEEGWAHDVAFEGIVERTWPGRRARCTAGERAGPPEGVGGPSGYDDFLRAIADDGHPGHLEARAWHDGPFDPDAFDPSAVPMSDPDGRWKATYGSRGE